MSFIDIPSMSAELTDEELSDIVGGQFFGGFGMPFFGGFGGFGMPFFGGFGMPFFGGFGFPLGIW